MIVDYLNVSFPEESMSEVRTCLLKLIFQAGAKSISTKDSKTELYRIQSGTVRMAERRGYHLVGLSGTALSVLRQHDLYTELLSLISGVSHKVTSLDIAHDVRVHAPKVVKSLYKRLSSTEGLHLTRKQVHSFNKVMRPSLYSSEETGTVYLGRRTSEVYAKVYDKRNEIMEKTGMMTVDPLTRYELTVTNKAGVSLSDAHNPDACFWHFMSQVLPTPKGWSDNWVKGGFSFGLPALPVKLPADVLADRVEQSGDLELMLRLSGDMGPNGLDHLIRLIRARASSVLPDQPQTSLQGA